LDYKQNAVSYIRGSKMFGYFLDDQGMGVYIPGS